MCVILHCETSKPSLHILERCHTANPDGIGIAWKKGKQIHWLKGLTLYALYHKTLELPLPYVIHFRLATVGKGIGLCHPFPLTEDVSTELQGKADSVLFHNGHYAEWRDRCFDLLTHNSNLRLPKGELSDTRAIAWMVKILGLDILQLLTDRFIVFSAKAGIVKYGTFINNSGIYFSNMIWKSTYSYDKYNNRISIIDYEDELNKKYTNKKIIVGP